MKTKVISISLLLWYVSCTYYHDELKISNNSGRIICYETLVYDPSKKVYSLGPANDSVPINQTQSPVVKLSIRKKLEMQNYDSLLYLLFCNCGQRQELYRDPDKFVKEKSDKIDRLSIYSISQLDSLKWEIRFH